MHLMCDSWHAQGHFSWDIVYFINSICESKNEKLEQYVRQ
jgi:hypothetical protein